MWSTRVSRCVLCARFHADNFVTHMQFQIMMETWGLWIMLIKFVEHSGFTLWLVRTIPCKQFCHTHAVLIKCSGPSQHDYRVVQHFRKGGTTFPFLFMHMRRSIRESSSFFTRFHAHAAFFRMSAERHVELIRVSCVSPAAGGVAGEGGQEGRGQPTPCREFSGRSHSPMDSGLSK